MPAGKPAGVICAQLSADYRCRLFGQAQRPAVCAGFQPAADTCGTSRQQALAILNWMENCTRG